tara:strand:+ start:941 stop:1183 length:243 start_codon:yes stop_codon:yes gene_type:complete
MIYTTWEYKKDYNATPNKVFVLSDEDKTYLVTPLKEGAKKAQSYLVSRGIDARIKPKLLYPITKQYFQVNLEDHEDDTQI